MDTGKEKQLRQVLSEAGVDNAGWWISEADAYNTPMMEIALFLKTAWRSIIRKNDTSWVSKATEDIEKREEIALADEVNLYALRFLPPNPELREALQRVSGAGVDPADLTTIVREFQIEALSQTIELLDGGQCFENGLEGTWGVCSLDDDLEPDRPFGDMKHLMWEFDPDKGKKQHDE